MNQAERLFRPPQPTMNSVHFNIKLSNLVFPNEIHFFKSCFQDAWIIEILAGNLKTGSLQALKFTHQGFFRTKFYNIYFLISVLSIEK